MLFIQLIGEFSSSTSERFLVHLNLIVINIVNITGLNPNLLEMLPIIQLHLLLQVLLKLHLPKLLSLDVLEHLLSLLLLLHLSGGTFSLHLLDSLNPLIICHIKFSRWI